MQSVVGFAAAVVLLLAVPLALLYELTVGPPEAVGHLLLAVGAGLMAAAALGFRTAGWIRALGVLSAGGFALVFAIQGVADLTDDSGLTQLAYGVLGQQPERWLGHLFHAWCAAVILSHSHGKTKLLGAAVLIAIAISETVQYTMAFSGTPLGDEASALKVLQLGPLVWVLFESGKTHEMPPLAALT